MMFNVLKHYHVMIGVPWLEKHDALFPPSVPAKMIPHLCGGVLCVPPWGALAGKPNPTEVSASGGIMLSQGTDMGALIPHVNIPPAPPNLLLPVLFLTSGSKSSFGAHKNTLPQGPVAFACLNLVNLNLNCAGPTMPPLPSGIVIAFNSHTTGVTVGDIVAGALRLLVDAAIQFGLNRLFNAKFMQAALERATFAVFGKLVQRIVGFPISYHAGEWLAMSLGSRIMSRTGEYFGRAAGPLVDAVVPAAVATLIGSPVGYSPGLSPVGGLGGSAMDKGQGAVANAVDDYFNDPAVEQHPSSAPASATDGSNPATSGAPASNPP